MPFSSSHWIMAGMASFTVLPVEKSELTRITGVVLAVNATFCTSSPPETTSMISQPNIGELPDPGRRGRARPWMAPVPWVEST